MTASDQPRPLERLDGLNAWIERPVRRLAGSDRFSPLPHAGTISVVLLGVVIVSGLYITLFFQYGFEASYEAVTRMEQHPIQRTVRALHRYSSAALVLTSVVHAWRIFVAGRFRVRRRRWRWLTGWAMLLVIWPAGVSGYLLVWDVRAEAIARAGARLVEVFGWGAAFSVRFLTPATTSSGSTFMVIVWFVHLGLTMVVAWFAYRHLSRSRLAWYPPRMWALAMGLALVVVSILIPAGMLSPASGRGLVPLGAGFGDGIVESAGSSVPLDPFVLFLLPLLESGARWWAVAGLVIVTGLGLALPLLVDRRSPPPPPVTVDPAACTGCNLCVVDCPYEAVTLQARPGGRGVGADEADGLVAMVESEACVACGICLGSCAFGALQLDGFDPVHPADSFSGTVVVACDRHRTDHDALATGDGHGVVQYVRCAGVVGVDIVKELTQGGADGVEVVGCAVGDCRYGVGNTLASERLVGDRVPHLPRAVAPRVTQRWGTTGDLGHGVTDAHLATTPGDGGRRALIGTGVIVVASAMGVAAATVGPFSISPSGADQAQVQVVVDQDPLHPLVAQADPGALDLVWISVDGEPRAAQSIRSWRDRRVGVGEWAVNPGSHRITVEANVVEGPDTAEGPETVVVYDAEIELAAGERLHIPLISEPEAPGVGAGREVFNSRGSGCAVCHSVIEGEDGVGPSLYGLADVAGGRVAGLDAEGYIWQSILLPDEYLVDGYPAGQMLPIYRERLTPDELDAVITYLMSLEAES